MVGSIARWSRGPRRAPTRIRYLCALKQTYRRKSGRPRPERVAAACTSGTYVKPAIPRTPANPTAVSSSIRSSWLYFAWRSALRTDPILICPAPVATAKSAMNESSVSPERADTTVA